MQGSSTWFDCAPLADVESKMQGLRTEFVIDCTHVLAKESKLESTMLIRKGSREFETSIEFELSKEFESGKVRLFPANTPYIKKRQLMTNEEKEESWQHRRLLYSQVAIAYYNANNPAAEIELVEAGPTGVVIHRLAMWYHFNFKARPKNSDSPDPSPKLYFTEILHRGIENHVTTVCVVDPLDSESTINGCEYCSPDPTKYRIYHPKDGKWTAGRLMQPLSLSHYVGWRSKMQESKVFACDPVAAKESEMQGSKTVIDCASVAAEESKPGSNLLYRFLILLPLLLLFFVLRLFALLNLFILLDLFLSNYIFFWIKT